ncbi:hypothetical protein [Pseudogemmobacter bohemicus]|uniref:hypothetical protein n=1 Tax=Pseudogemmobacter bohemicus TaxID=2250708 RepID=UPI00130089D1|nr:hypothetical protein [Pseudogemmobacter bohemicus]
MLDPMAQNGAILRTGRRLTFFDGWPKLAAEYRPALRDQPIAAFYVVARPEGEISSICEEDKDCSTNAILGPP